MALSCLQLLPLLLLVVLRGALGTPLYDSDLADLKTLLERFEVSHSSENGLISSQNALGQNYENRKASHSAPFVGRDNSRYKREPMISEGSWELPERANPVKNQLRELLISPRHLRSSNCFGERLDKIGTQSGMGCNNEA